MLKVVEQITEVIIEDVVNVDDMYQNARSQVRIKNT